MRCIDWQSVARPEHFVLDFSDCWTTEGDRNDLINRPPLAVIVRELIGPHYPLRGLEYVFRANRGTIKLLTVVGKQVGQLNVQSHELPFSGYDHDRPVTGTVDSTPHPDVGLWCSGY